MSPTDHGPWVQHCTLHILGPQLLSNCREPKFWFTGQQFCKCYIPSTREHRTFLLQQKHFPSLSGPLQVFPNLILLGAHFQLSSKTAFFSANFKRKKQNHSSSHSQHSWSILSSRITLQNPQLLPSRENFARLLQEAKDKIVHLTCIFYNQYQIINKQAGKTLIIIPYHSFFSMLSSHLCPYESVYFIHQ